MAFPKCSLVGNVIRELSGFPLIRRKRSRHPSERTTCYIHKPFPPQKASPPKLPKLRWKQTEEKQLFIVPERDFISDQPWYAPAVGWHIQNVQNTCLNFFFFFISIKTPITCPGPPPYHHSHTHSWSWLKLVGSALFASEPLAKEHLKTSF